MLNAIRSIGSARLVDEVPALVIDLAIDLTHAERGSDAIAPGGEAFGDDRILEVVLGHLSETPEQITGAVMAAVRAFCHDACQRDDITLVVLRCGV